MPVQVVDLFCGVGGLTHGMIAAGLLVIAGFDNDETCRFAYEQNNETRFFNSDVKKITGAQINALYDPGATRVLVGCAPCQPFSNMTTKWGKNESNDGKWDLLSEFGRIIQESLPDIVSMENVPKI